MKGRTLWIFGHVGQGQR